MSVEEEEFKPGGARAGPEHACGACWVRTGRRMWKANALVQAIEAKLLEEVDLGGLT